MFSDLSQTELKNSMMNAIKESPTIGQDAKWGATIIKMMDQMVPAKVTFTFLIKEIERILVNNGDMVVAKYIQFQLVHDVLNS